MQELTGVEALAFDVTDDNLDADDVFVRKFVAVVFEIAHSGIGFSVRCREKDAAVVVVGGGPPSG
jgi:hypothetical protein